MLRFRPHVPVALCAALLAPAGLAFANPEPATLGKHQEDVPEIWGGDASAECGWPSVVALDDYCTGTLVHPELVVTAAHCIEGPLPVVHFGSSYQDPARTVSVVECARHPDFTDSSLGVDIAWCRLAESVEDVQIIPLMAGCESDAVVTGQQTAVVGFGLADDALGDGRKREVWIDVEDPNVDGELFIGGQGLDSCLGDSGGPAFVPLADGTWRLAGVVSSGLGLQDDPCGGGGYYTRAWLFQSWLESTSGLDLTPCHDDEGSWVGGSDCGGSPRDPEADVGTWDTACARDLVARTEVCEGGEEDPTTGGDSSGDSGGMSLPTSGGTAGSDLPGRPIEDEGCACRSSEGPRGAAILGLAFLLGLAARPRRSRVGRARR